MHIECNTDEYNAAIATPSTTKTGDTFTAAELIRILSLIDGNTRVVIGTESEYASPILNVRMGVRIKETNECDAYHTHGDLTYAFEDAVVAAGPDGSEDVMILNLA